MSTTITADRNLSIEFDSDRWRLFLSRMPTEPDVLEATSIGIFYSEAFANARRLPAEGQLLADSITFVGLGWSTDDQGWHLGLLLEPPFAQARGGRWCELARWDDSVTEQAQLVAAGLAEVLNKPMRILGREASATDAAAGLRSTTPAYTLPLSVGDWTVSESPVGLEWTHSKAWQRDQLVRTAFFAIITPLFGLLSVGALISPFADVQPEWLPYVGLGLTAIMALLAVLTFRGWLTARSTQVNRSQGVLRQMRQATRPTLQVPFEGIEYILVSHVVTRRQPVKESPRDLAIFEVWIHASTTRRGFIDLCHTENIEGRLLRNFPSGTRVELSLLDLESAAHYAAWRIAKEIGVPIYAEQR